MSRVVSLTPARLERDSRTLKEASTIGRLGHRSTVLEGLRSAEPFAGAPFDVLTVGSVGEALAEAGGAAAGRPAAARRRVERLAALAGRLAGPAYFLASWIALNVRTARALPRADLCWLHGYEQALAVWLRRVPYVYDAHDLYAALPFDGRRLGLGERATHRVRAAIERACIRRAAACVTTSGPMARAYERRSGRAFAVIRNAQDARRARRCARDVRSAAGAGAGEFLLAMVAQRKPGTVIPGRLPDGVRLALVGDGYPDAPAPPGVSYVGSVAPDEVASFISTADAAALLYAPVSANSPLQLVNGLFHAVAAGLPLLLPARMDAIRELGERHRLGVVVDPVDPRSLAAGVAALRERLDEHRAAVRAAAAELSWEREEDAVAAVLDAALGN